MLVLLFGGVEIARVFYMYHTLQKALRGGAGLLSRSVNVNYCDSCRPDARRCPQFRRLWKPARRRATRLCPGLTTDMIQILPEREVAGTTGVTECVCTEDADSCDVTSGGRAPDFVVVNLGSGFPLPMPFPFVNLGTINLKVSVRMPVTGS